MRTPLINRKHVRDWALDWAKANREHKFERVSESFLIGCQIHLRNYIIDQVKRHPSKGITLQ
jgi:hypothetical protein